MSKSTNKSCGARTAKPLPKLKKRSANKGTIKVAFKPKQTESIEDVLSFDEKEELVLEFRLKARKLARSILRKWHARLDLQEVDSIVDLSLCEAVKRFDPEKGASFMTFLFYHLRGNLIRAVTAAASANAVPVEAEEGAEGEDKYKRTSIFKGANAIEIAEALSGHESMLPDEVLYKKELVKLSKSACANLDDLEKQVIERIYLKGHQLMDIANSLGYSRCHISRVKKKALSALKNEMNDTIQFQATNDGDAGDFLFSSDRRKIHRRRPRSKKALEAQKEIRGQEAAA
ncbi:MAG: sigma-70 family RNA polymerase sigma factor [Bdellovibrionales bacterium]|nr:sigma-70 family RNA polymerase sigma factor [Bdellovibrionales bacterium]